MHHIPNNEKKLKNQSIMFRLTISALSNYLCFGHKHPGNNACTQREAYFKFPPAINRAVHYPVIKKYIQAPPDVTHMWLHFDNLNIQFQPLSIVVTPCAHMRDLLSVSSPHQVIYADAKALPLHSIVNAHHDNNTQEKLNTKK